MARWREDPGDDVDYEAAEDAAQRWARDLLAREDFVIVDCATTGLAADSQPVQVAVLSAQGERLLFRSCLPHDGVVPADAAAVHGLTMAVLQERKAVPFPRLWPRIVRAVGEKRIVAYNADFDRRVLATACRLATLEFLPNLWVDVMPIYAQWVGEWWAWKGDWKWQPLPGSRHSALADCRAVLRVLQKMAADPAEPSLYEGRERSS